MSREEGRGKREEGRGKREEGRGRRTNDDAMLLRSLSEKECRGCFTQGGSPGVPALAG
jgi:hypothetical protein